MKRSHADAQAQALAPAPALTLTLTLTLTLAALGACLPDLAVPPGARLLCDDDAQCPTGLVCADGKCRDAVDACLLQDGAGFVADGTACPSGICVGGTCGPSSCGDGYVDVAALEVCDPASDPLCGDDCRPALCGDREVDPGETCDPPGPGCNACVRECVDDTAECDLDVATACECSADRVYDLADDELLFAHGAIGASGVYVVVENFDEARLYFVPDGGAPVLLDDAEFFIAVVRDDTDGTVYGMVNAQRTTQLYRLDGDTMVPIGGNNGLALGDLRVHSGKLYSDDGDDVVVFDAATGDELERIAPECGSPYRFVICGDQVLCVPLDSETLTAVPLAGGEARELDASVGPSFGCVVDPDGVERAVWTDGINLFMEVGGGGRAVLRALPPSSADSNEELVVIAMLPFDGGILLSDLSSTGIVSWRYDFGRRDLLGISEGAPLDANAQAILLESGGSARLIRR